MIKPPSYGKKLLQGQACSPMFIEKQADGVGTVLVDRTII